MSVASDRASRCTRKRVREGAGTLERGSQLQLQLLGGGEAARGICDDASISGSGGSGAVRTSSLLDVSIESSEGLKDDELAAASRALPGPRQLKVMAAPRRPADSAAGPRGPGPAALSACRGLQVLELDRCTNLDGGSWRHSCQASAAS